MSRKPANKASFQKAAKKAAYYSFLDVTESSDVEGAWEIGYFVSGSDDVGDEDSPVTYKHLKAMFNKHYKNSTQKPAFEDESSKNFYLARVPTKADAERAIAEMIYIFQQEGLQPMKTQASMYQPLPSPRAPKL